MFKIKKIRLKRNQLRILILASLLALVLFLCATGLSFIDLINRQQLKLDTFTTEQIKLSAKEPLTAEFVETNKFNSFNYSIQFENKTEYSYTAVLDGEVEETEVSLSEHETITLAPKSTTDLSISLPLQFETEIAKDQPSYERVLKITLKITENFNQLLPQKEADIELKLPISLITIAETNLAKAEILDFTKRLEYKPEQKPKLQLKLKFDNLTDFAVSEGYYEIDLINEKGERIQPLLVEKLNLEAKKQVELSPVFTFQLPPANQLSAGTQKYKLKLIYIGQFGARKFSLTAISADALEFHVINV